MGLPGQGHDDDGKRTTGRKKAEKKQLTHALLESLIIIRGMLTTDN